MYVIGSDSASRLAGSRPKDSCHSASGYITRLACQLPAARRVSDKGERHAGLKPLDLGSLPGHDSGPPSELQARRNKFAQFEHQCSEVQPGIFLGSEAVAKSRERLKAAGITHVINCVGQYYPDYFADELTYLSLSLLGAPSIVFVKHRISRLQVVILQIPILCWEFTVDMIKATFPVLSRPREYNPGLICVLVNLWRVMITDACFCTDAPGEDITSVLYDVFDFIEVCTAAFSACASN